MTDTEKNLCAKPGLDEDESRLLRSVPVFSPSAKKRLIRRCKITNAPRCHHRTLAPCRQAAEHLSSSKYLHSRLPCFGQLPFICLINTAGLKGRDEVSVRRGSSEASLLFKPPLHNTDKHVRTAKDRAEFPLSGSDSFLSI